jgi:hypothetical protein
VIVDEIADVLVLTQELDGCDRVGNDIVVLIRGVFGLTG